MALVKTTNRKFRIIKSMKRSKLILLGSLGIAAIATVLVVSPFAFNSKSEYNKNQLSFLQEKSADDAAAWIAARYFDPTTGERITQAKLQLIEKAVKSMTNSKALPLTWEEKGPDNIGGRTRAIVVDRDNNNNVWAGSVTGGLFRSTNKGSNWVKVDNYPGSKNIGSMTQLANGAILVATGFTYPNWESWDGDGVWYTMDNGDSWTIVPGTSNIAQVKKIVAAPNSTTAYLATPTGLKSWTFGNTSLTNVPTTSGGCSEVRISTDGSVIVAAMGSNKTYVSTDGGASFSDKSGSGSNQVVQGAARIEYAISPTKNSAGKYNIYATRTSSTNLQGMNVSQDNGDNWTQFIGAANPNGNLNIYNGQAGYNSIVTVDPTDPERIFIGGLDVWKWKQTGTNPISGGFTKLSNWFAQPTTPKYVHADNHEMKFDGNNRFYIGNDGGIGITNDFGDNFYPSNRGYNVTQFYGMAFDKYGAVIGGAQDNGTLYNDYSLSTYQEFREVSGGDGVQCEISFFNPNIMFVSSQSGEVRRSIDKGASTSDFKPSYPSNYTAVDFPFHTCLGLVEYFDPNSKDSVDYGANKNYAAGANVRIPSAATGDTINYTTPTPMYYDAFVENDPTLTETRISVKNAINGLTVLLGNYNYTYISGVAPPTIGDSLLVQLPTGPDTVVVQSTSTYKWYFAKHPISNKIIELGKDSTAQSVSWDSVRVADPFQSWFYVYTTKNGGELWGTRNALRTNTINPNWVIMAQGIGAAGGNSIDVEWSKDLNKCYISSGSAIWRVDGLGNLYTSQPSFPAENTVVPNNSTKTQVLSAVVEGIALNPNDENDLIMFPGLGNARRSSNAGSASPTFTTLGSLSGANSPFLYDGIIDRDDEDIIVVGTHIGVFVSSNGGASWTNSSGGFEGTPVYEVRQSTRTWNEGNSRPGEIYIATFGRGIFSSSSLLSIADYNQSSNDNFKTKLKTYPNPTTASTTLSFNLAQSGVVNVAVYSITGTKVKTIQTKMSKGDGLIDIEANELPRGTYIVKFTSGSQTETTKFIKM